MRDYLDHIYELMLWTLWKFLTPLSVKLFSKDGGQFGNENSFKQLVGVNSPVYSRRFNGTGRNITYGVRTAQGRVASGVDDTCCIDKTSSA